jgi:hypothetical protein
MKKYLTDQIMKSSIVDSAKRKDMKAKTTTTGRGKRRPVLAAVNIATKDNIEIMMKSRIDHHIKFAGALRFFG